jgi:hypothetical protein
MLQVGKMTTPEGAVYEGNWRLNRPHGQGTMTYPSGIVWRGEWRNGVRVEAVADDVAAAVGGGGGGGGGGAKETTAVGA